VIDTVKEPIWDRIPVSDAETAAEFIEAGANNQINMHGARVYLKYVQEELDRMKRRWGVL
jgi:maleate cis-trans isomerase